MNTSFCLIKSILLKKFFPVKIFTPYSSYLINVDERNFSLILFSKEKDLTIDKSLLRILIGLSLEHKHINGLSELL